MPSKILITGGSGTLGHAIVISAMEEGWDSKFTIYSRSELRLAEMKARFPHIQTVVGDVRDFNRLRAIVTGHDVVIHAAAMKRIPECEQNPEECYLTNILGTDNVARACLGDVEKVVAISTDKACEAITMYGASKLANEAIFLSYAKQSKTTKYSVVRYGNVVASNGSVIPIWEEQYRSGQCLTITDKRMTRFWMSPFDAVDAINISMLHPGLVYVPKIRSCKMVDIANHLFPNNTLREIGLRSSEKLHESLISKLEMSREVSEYGFLVGEGTLGNSYNSRDCESLDMIDFNRMLAESKEIEK